MTALPLQPLRHTRILSLALNLPGPAALLRCAQMGAECTKLEPVAPDGNTSADPMAHYSPQAYAALHPGLRLLPGRFMVIQQAMGLAKTRGDAAAQWLAAFVEEAKASGFIADALARHNIQGAGVAPAA